MEQHDQLSELANLASKITLKPRDLTEGLTESQKIAFEAVRRGQSIFITGPGGCGKSFLIERIKTWCVEIGKTIAVTALTGKAAVLIGGKTIHSWAGIRTGTGTVEELYMMIRRNSNKMKDWVMTDILIIDEISMMSAELWNKLVLLAQRVRRFGGGFGGLQLVLSGDFCQLPPVKADAYCFQSSLFTEVVSEVVEMTEMIRQTDPTFIKLLTEVRFGRKPQWVIDMLMSRMIEPAQFESLMTSTDGELSVKPTVLYPLKRDVAAENERELIKLRQSIMRFNSTDKCYPMENTKYGRKKGSVEMSFRKADREIAERMFDQRNVGKTLYLALGAQVMYLINEKDTPLVNGSKGVVTGFDGKMQPIVKFDEESGGVEITVEQHEFETESGNKLYVRRQLPLILCWAITCHKAQGATLSKVITDLGQSFCAGQVYTTLSRVRSLEGLFLLGFNPARVICDPDVVKWYEDLRRKTALTGRG